MCSYEDTVQAAATSANRGNEIILEREETIQYTAASAGKCSCCGNQRHERSRCPAMDKFCFMWKKGIFPKFAGRDVSNLKVPVRRPVATGGIRGQWPPIFYCALQMI